MVRNSKIIVANCIFWCIQSIKIFFQIPHGCCRFSPTCSEYAKESLEKLPVTKAIPVIIKRVLKCHPLNEGGYDPVHDCHINTKG